MKKIVGTMTALILIIGTSFLIMQSCNTATENGKNKTDIKTSEIEAVSSGCNCQTSWFPHSQTPAPSEGIGSPFDNSSSTNCIFHQWSWQKFLWLTKPMKTGRTLFEDSMILVTNTMQPVHPIKGIDLILSDTAQAGTNSLGQHGVLRSNPNYNPGKKSYTVFYGIYINSILQKAATAMLDSVKGNPDNHYTFPVGALELKSSWIDTNALASGTVNNYYTTTALINGKKTGVALLGLHVVGRVQNHPEFIWATFEHHDMAPLYNWKETSQSDLPVTSNTENLFFRKGDTSTYQTLQYNTSPPAHSVFAIYQYGIPLVAGGGFMATSQNERTPPTNHENLENLNNCVAAGLQDVWKNYFYNGSIWINMDGLTTQQQADTTVSLGFGIGSATPGSMARGCLAAYNITMETFQQDFFDTSLVKMNSTTIGNCFGCHNAPVTYEQKTFTSPLYVSHIFQGYVRRNIYSYDKRQIDLFRIQSFLNSKKSVKAALTK